MNFIITSTCNRSCPYCFAKNKLSSENKTETEHVSLENVQHYYDFLEKNNDKSLRILGGEPTQHPQFIEIIDMALERKFNINIFTNGIWNNNITDYFRTSKTKNINFLFNINEPGKQPEKELIAIKNSLSVAKNRARCGYNIYSKEFDITFLADFIDKYSLKREIRLGLTSPIVGTKNHYITDDTLKEVGTRLVNQLEQLERKNIIGILDCGFILCMFSEQELGKLTISTKKFNSVCDVTLDIGTDLSVWPCFPLSNMNNAKLTDFDNYYQINNFFEKRLLPFRKFGMFDQCLTCKFKERGQCSGGCVARTIKNWQETSDKELLLKI